MTKLMFCLDFCGKVCLNLWIATLALLARNDGKLCHFEHSALAQSDQATCRAQPQQKFTL